MNVVVEVGRGVTALAGSLSVAGHAGRSVEVVVGVAYAFAGDGAEGIAGDAGAGRGCGHVGYIAAANAAEVECEVSRSLAADTFVAGTSNTLPSPSSQVIGILVVVPAYASVHRRTPLKTY